jgi:hypothetical protein
MDSREKLVSGSIEVGAGFHLPIAGDGPISGEMRRVDFLKWGCKGRGYSNLGDSKVQVVTTVSGVQ